MSGGGGESTTNNQPPQYIQDQHRQNLDIGNILADRPYQPYTGPRIADFTPDQQAGMQAVRNEAGANFGTGWGVARGVADGSAPQIARGDIRNVTAQGFDGAKIGSYMNPYIGQVVDTTMTQLGRQNDILQNRTNAAAAAAGAFGGSRQAILNAENNRSFLDTAANTTANLYNTGYNTATGLQQADANRALQADMANQSMDWNAASGNAQLAAQQNALKLQAANQMANSSLAEQQRAFGNAQALMGIGQTQQGMDQSNYDLAYSDYMRQMGYPMDQLQVRNGLLAGPVGSTQTTNTKTDNTGQLVGSGMMAAATVAAAYF